MKTFFTLLFVAFISVAEANSLKNFTTDGCTLFVDGPLKAPGLWKNCCIEHDLRYWFGGDRSDMDRADLQIKTCVNELAGPVWANLIYEGIRLGHHSPIKNKTHWSWGWEATRLNNPLSTTEILYIIGEIRGLPYDPDFLEKFINRNFTISHDDI